MFKLVFDSFGIVFHPEYLPGQYYSRFRQIDKVKSLLGKCVPSCYLKNAKRRRGIMAEGYTVLNGTGEGYYEEKRSRFPAAAYPVRTEEEALFLIAAEKKKTYDARHHCWAYVLGRNNEICRFSDDGEPSGTAGKPILEVLLGQELHDVLIIVTRYFGGTLLGTGGLVRAYSSAAADAAAHAPRAEVLPVRKASVSCDYTDLSRIDKLIHGPVSVFEGERCYTEKADLLLYLPEDSLDAFSASLGDASSGRAKLELLEETEIVVSSDRFLREYTVS